ncbi:MAG: LysM peptidoglycan-binding domain-containing protein, partial [Candidatus Aenigmarchaeota archaeon]|nr:LysM peptidoglycan-binding domain-containing protein [Candidatus Aenigmarchaeota archaeon]
VSPGPSGSEAPESSTRETSIVVIKEGDNLFKIITQAYGRYNKAMLDEVLRKNPDIKSPEHIMVGQVIKLPKK